MKKATGISRREFIKESVKRAVNTTVSFRVKY